MPIYAYRCTRCGHAQDVLRKVSDPLLTVCPACGADTFAKQVTAAGFQLKGSGWYVTDFRGGNNAAPKKDDEKAQESAGDKPAADKSAAEAGAAKADKPATDGSAAASPASSPSPAPGPAASPPSSAPSPTAGT